MRVAGFGIAAVMVVTFTAGAYEARAQRAEAPEQAEAKKAPNTFSGVKLLDLNARKPEQTVTVKLHEDKLTVVDPATKTDVASMAYAGTTVTHRVSSAPPAIAGDPGAAATQPMAPPMYMGKTPHNWLTFKSGSDTIVLRVSEKVYAQLRDALASHNVLVQEEK